MTRKNTTSPQDDFELKGKDAPARADTAADAAGTPPAEDGARAVEEPSHHTGEEKPAAAVAAAAVEAGAPAAARTFRLTDEGAASLKREADALHAPRDAAGLRTDGPTLAEFVAAGYDRAKYPPRGFAEKLEVTVPSGEVALVLQTSKVYGPDEKAIPRGTLVYAGRARATDLLIKRQARGASPGEIAAAQGRRIFLPDHPAPAGHEARGAEKA